eukprot:Lankesteria_metandrocarpae@DN3477_c0_g1_i1.p1
MRLLLFVLVNSVGLCNCFWRDVVRMVTPTTIKTAKVKTTTTTVKTASTRPSQSVFSKWKWNWPSYPPSSKTVPTNDKRVSVTKGREQPDQSFNIFKWWKTTGPGGAPTRPVQGTSTTTVQSTTVQLTTVAPTTSIPAAVPVDAVVVEVSDDMKPTTRENNVMPIAPPVEVISESIAKHWIPKDMSAVRGELWKFQLCLDSCDSHLSGVITLGNGGVALKQRDADAYVRCSETCVKQRRAPPKSPTVVAIAPTADAFFKRVTRLLSTHWVGMLLILGACCGILLGYTVKKRNALSAIRRTVVQNFPLLEVYLSRLLDSQMCHKLSHWWSSVCQFISHIVNSGPGGQSSNSLKASLNKILYNAGQFSEHFLSARWLPDEWAVYIPWSDAAVRIAQDNASPLLSNEEDVNRRGAECESDRRASSTVDIQLTVSSRHGGGRQSTGNSGSGRQSTGGSGSGRQSTGGSGSGRQSTGGSGSGRQSTGGSGSGRQSTG